MKNQRQFLDCAKLILVCIPTTCRDISRYCSERTSRRTALRHLSCSELDDAARRIDTAILRQECQRRESRFPMSAFACRIIERLSHRSPEHYQPRVFSSFSWLSSKEFLILARGKGEHAVVDGAANLPCCLRFNCDSRLVNKHASGTVHRRSPRQMEILCGPAGPPAGYRSEKKRRW